MTRPSLAPDRLEEIVDLRRALHRNPELSGEERETAARIAGFLAELRPDALITGFGGHGLAAVFQGQEAGETVLARCELDALPIQEESRASYRSRIEGRGHLCGHDGHMAILCAVASRLAERRPARGRAVLLFQPAEETGEGARAVVVDPKFAALTPDYAFALHNLPGVALGHVRIKQGTFACASRGCRIRFSGRVAHSSQPETGITPVNALSDYMREAQYLGRGAVGDEDYALVTVIHARLGEPSFGVLPGSAEAMVTLRTARDDALEDLARKNAALAEMLAARDGLTVEIGYAEDFRATMNHPDAVRVVEEALRALGAPYALMNAPMRWSEDFGVFAAVTKSALFGIGSGTEQPALHNSDYDFPDALIEPAADIFVRIFDTLLG